MQPEGGLVADGMTLRLLIQQAFNTFNNEAIAGLPASGKPKPKKADPNRRGSCKNSDAPPPDPAGTRFLSCTNVTLDQFVERFQGMGADFNWPVANQTGLEGTWDVSLAFGRAAGAPRLRQTRSWVRRVASDPNGAVTIFEAVEKRLGLKLEKQKRSMQVIVIDHIEQKSTEN